MNENLLIPLFIIIPAALYAIYIELRLRNDSLELTKTYSYKKVFFTLLFFLMITTIICSAIYLLTKSKEVSISLFIILVAFIFVGLLKGLLFEYHIKKRNTKK